MTAWDGTGVDPFLPERIARELDAAAAERRVYRAWWSSMSDWMVRVNRSVLGSGIPDPNGVWTHVPMWAEMMATVAAGPIADTVGLAYSKLFGPDFLFDQRPAVTAYLGEVQNRLVNTPNQVYDAVASQVARGAAAGESIPAIAARVDEVLTATGSDNWRGRATVIARTETLGALSFGRYDAFTAVADALGGEFMVAWLATLDRRVRPAHHAADVTTPETGQRVPLGTPFLVGGEHLMRPGDPAGSAANVIQCRCSTLLERPGESTSQVGRGFADADAWWARQIQGG